MTTQYNIISDLGTWTKIPNKILAELVRKTNLCIGSALHDAKQAKESIAVLQLGIGTLSVNMEDMQCKFIPSKELKTAIKNSLVDGVDPLEKELEEALVEKLITLCDEVL